MSLNSINEEKVPAVENGFDVEGSKLIVTKRLSWLTEALRYLTGSSVGAEGTDHHLRGERSRLKKLCKGTSLRPSSLMELKDFSSLIGKVDGGRAKEIESCVQKLRELEQGHRFTQGTAENAEQNATRVSRIAQTVWTNLQKTGYARKAWELSHHAGRTPFEEYDFVEFSFRQGDGNSVQIVPNVRTTRSRNDYRVKLDRFIEPENAYDQESIKTWQLDLDRATASIWNGVSVEDLVFLAKYGMPQYQARFDYELPIGRYKPLLEALQTEDRDHLGVRYNDDKVAAVSIFLRE